MLSYFCAVHSDTYICMYFFLLSEPGTKHIYVQVCLRSVALDCCCGNEFFFDPLAVTQRFNPSLSPTLSSSSSSSSLSLSLRQLPRRCRRHCGFLFTISPMFTSQAPLRLDVWNPSLLLLIEKANH